MEHLPKGSKKLLNAWAFYDWANSVYTLTIASSIFPIFYSSLFVGSLKTVNAFGFEFKNTALITFVTAFTFIADRIDHCKKIQRWLDSGKIVICDRYSESTYAYQAAQMQGIVENPLKWLKELSVDRIITPDRTFLFVIEPKDSLARIQHRDNLIPFEKLDFLEKVHKNYLEICKGPRFKHLDATKTIEELTKICYDDIIGK